MPGRTCQREGCNKPLPPGSATQRKYCTERCQVAAWRARNQPKPEGPSAQVQREGS